MLILFTGLRKSETLTLQWKDIDFEQREIYITKAWYVKSNRPYIKSTKKETGKRIVPLLDPLKNILSTLEKPEDYIFGFPDGSKYKRLWDSYRKTTGLKCSVHQIRHEFVTMLYDADINKFDAMHIVGHADISATAELL